MIVGFKHIVSDIPLLKAENIGVVCHDAGAANIIIAYLLDAGGNNWRPYMQGPAKRLWEEAFPELASCDGLDSVLEGVDFLITGTGWGSDIEHEARKLACQRGIQSVAVIDHWINYRARFVRNGVETLPDEIWVTDEYAKKLAESEFENIDVVQMPNLYLVNIVEEIGIHEDMNSDGKNLLYLLEPIRNTWGDDVINGEFKALDFFVKNLSALGMNKAPSIRLRPHPSDPSDKYDQWISGQNSLNIAIDESVTLAKAIAWSDVVVGCQTYAMVIGLAVGRQVFSSIPPWAPPCILPQKDIIKISVLTHKKSSAADINN